MKSLKAIVLRCKQNKEDLSSAIAAWRNMARGDGIAPTDLFLGRRQLHRLPMPLGTPKKQGNHDASHASSTDQRNKATRMLPKLQVGDTALAQNKQTGKWEKEVQITGINPSKLSFEVTDKNGSTYSRGRKLLRKRIKGTAPLFPLSNQ